MIIQSIDPENVGMSSERLNLIAPAMQTWVDRGTIAGACMMVARRNKIVYCEQVGQLNMSTREAIPRDAIFRVYSQTKPIVCTALMTLYEEGRFQLSTPVAKFIPALKNLKVLHQDVSGITTEENLLRPITIGDLMKHTAGFTYDFLVDSPVSELYRQVELIGNAGKTLEQFVQTLAQLPLAYQPGTKWHYSVAVDVAAYLIEILTERPLRDVLQKRIFMPLGMVDTDFVVPEEKLPRLAAMYGAGDLLESNMTFPKLFTAWQEGTWKQLEVDNNYPLAQPETFARGGHGLFSTTKDYMRFVLMLLNHGTLNGVRILGRKTIELMHANHLSGSLLPLRIGETALNGYGFGLGSRRLLDVGLAGVPGSVGEFGWAGIASTYHWVDPVEELVGVFMTQYQGMDEPDRIFRILTYQAIVD